MSKLEFGTYHENMECVFKYLCSEVRASGESFDIKFHNRNAAHFINTGTQLFPCFQHWHSFSPCKQKLAVVISTFHRISRSCNSWTDVLEAVSTMKQELLSLKYPLRVLLRAAGRMATTDARSVGFHRGRVARRFQEVDGVRERGLGDGPRASLPVPIPPTTTSRVHTHCAKSLTSA